MYVEGKLKEYLDDLASNKPAPGGGSAAAATGALGVALLSMVANFTIGKKKYKDVEQEITETLNSAEKLRAELEKLIDEDITAYGEVSSAYGMPKDTDEQKAARTEAIQKALKIAMQVPLKTCNNLYEAIQLCDVLLEKGNQNLVSDVGVGAEFISSGYSAALLNVEINLSGIKDKELVEKTRSDLSAKAEQVTEIHNRIIEGTKEKI